jgi:L-alanine-DL-glutamate epimerase-like enolase superfamily enzyme
LRITEVRSAGLRHGPPEGGWANELKADDCVHTLVAVFTDEGETGWGSVFTNDELVRSALHVLAPLYTGENPLEPERVIPSLPGLGVSLNMDAVEKYTGERFGLVSGRH